LISKVTAVIYLVEGNTANGVKNAVNGAKLSAKKSLTELRIIGRQTMKIVSGQGMFMPVRVLFRMRGN